ncbi:hypothetical protein Mgra_00005767 [Meloidogyne graminicola]|uniref:Uncharacterized protein n=1 Tax=Meloidogyne graminicola TaxID=189291 RepID=A0A8S9ZNJ8_9BILA|nr:hypothetical protein Mgra_00005767 [Meloidogyne graminicola]
MLTILSDNENLLERLELLSQNIPKPQHDDKPISSPVKARSLLLGKINANLINNDVLTQLFITKNKLEKEENSEFCKNWLILIGKRSLGESQAALEAFSDLFRFSLAMRGSFKFNNNNKEDSIMRILIAKKEPSDDDEIFLREQMDNIRKNWIEQWGNCQLNKFRRFGESNALKEQLERTNQWMDESKEIGELCCALAYFDEPEFINQINKFFNFDESGFEILDSFDQENDSTGQRQLFNKAPALHWTNYPRETDVQVTFKFIFPKGTIPEWLFRDWISMAKDQVEWNYKYEWNNGVLLRADELVKITLIRLQEEPNVIELSGRIDTEEALEEELQERRDNKQLENGQEFTPSCPLKRVWPFLVRIFQPLISDIESYKTLPFHLSLVFVGECFFNCSEGAQKLTARSLDAIQTLSSIQRIKNVRFKADQDQIYSLNLEQCFPDFRPTKMSDFNEEQFPLPKQHQENNFQSQCPLSPLLLSSSNSDEPATSATSLGDSRVQSPRILMEKKRVDRSPSCVPSFDGRIEICSSLSSSPQPQNSLNVEGQTISGYNNFCGERKSEEEEEEEEQNNEKDITKSALVENIVDEMLQKAIDHGKDNKLKIKLINFKLTQQQMLKIFYKTHKIKNNSKNLTQTKKSLWLKEKPVLSGQPKFYQNHSQSGDSNFNRDFKFSRNSETFKI